MTLTRKISLVTTLLYLLISTASPARTQTVRERGVDEGKMKVFVDDLLAKMTLEEKLGQLNQHRWSYL